MRFINQQTSLGGNILYSKVIIGLYRDNTSWLVVEEPLGKILVKWDYCSQYMEQYNMFQTTNQQLIMRYNETTGL